MRPFLYKIPYWAYALVLLVMAVNSVYHFYKERVPADGLAYDQKNGKWVVVDYDPAGAGYRAGIRPGDTVLSVNSRPFETWLDGYQGKKAGDSSVYQIQRGSHKIGIAVVLGSLFSNVNGFFRVLYVFTFLFSFTSLYMLFKKPQDKAVMLFFIYMQLFAVLMNAWQIPSLDLPAVIANTVFGFNDCLLGPVLIHFHLLFPKPVKLLNRFKGFPFLLYFSGIIAFLLHNYFPDLLPVERIDLKWLTLTFLLAMATAVYQFLTLKNTLVRNQLRIIIIGSFFGLVTPVFYTFFYDFVNRQNNELFMIIIPQGTGSMIMICCILIALFRYRIWDSENIIRKALLYLVATAVIILSYLFLIWFVDLISSGETKPARFAILAVSVTLFLVLRDRLQRLIDRLFHRESYDSATVVSDFEGKLAGVYRFDELKEKIVQSLDEIFHFNVFVFNLKKDDRVYEAAYVFGIQDATLPADFEITPEMVEKLGKSNVFSPEELNEKPPFLELIKGDLIVPMISDNRPAGFFICGGKKSERIYSRQDINVLALLARRVIALLHTASLYQKDLDRQLMLERERARISHDMHDDIGAGLTKIAMISEAPVGMPDAGLGTREKMERIALSAREMIARLNVIVWALNPKYDNLESLFSYLRRYFGEYLENSGIQFKTDLPEQVPEVPITPDTRRNIFYAVQEAIHNAVKHSGGSAIGLTIQPLPPPGAGEKRERFLTITIADNGKGFDAVRPGSGGNGLLNMKKRAEELGGTFEIQSSPGIGTKVMFEVNF